MPRNPQQVDPAPPEAAAELDRRLRASDFTLTSLFVGRGNRMGDADVLAAAASITRTKQPRVLPRHEPDTDFTGALRQHLDGMNRQLVPGTLAEAIGAHLDAIGLDDIRHNPEQRT